ncbi:ETC complex I subunit conserved region-domain-containing protein [Kockovaella imperatae]|uniref:ETC complex I subunit conserved region-domain-containing protein n=1 Tax=Kockovaella imperatae TaxID=4999 RepID=A0A1Y1UHE2_9TREE|nr:ETC complex I subunit conserved region-domain-containing protein [Kockovaella imperatae]ORX37452.1 ETC complex I subunit conserved region-domain-containing protein [Kockovaella imperatae]
MFRASRVALAAAIKPMKASTGITGLHAVVDPLPTLKQHYQHTLNLLASLPNTSVYRQATEATTKHKMSIIDKANGDVKAVEKELGEMAEQSIQVAKDELKLAAKMLEWKPWEKLEEEAPPHQWRYFDPGSDEADVPSQH